LARKKPQKKRPRRPARQKTGGEDRRAEAITVVWMLCVLATLLAEVAGGVVRLAASWAGAEVVPQTVRILPGLMLFSALLTGSLSLILLPLAYHFRRTPPPPVVTACSATVAVLPLLICVWYAIA
jgi:hypothetical protein